MKRSHGGHGDRGGKDLGLRRRPVLCAAVLPLLAACGAQQTAGSGPATKSEYVVAPLQGSYGNLATDIARGQPLAEFLAKETGLRVRSYAPGDYTRTVAGLADGSLDLAFLPALLYLRARDAGGASALYRTLRPGIDGHPTAAFTAVIAVRADSGIGRLGDLRGKRIVGADPSDAAGWVLPAAQIKQVGLDLKHDVTVTYAKDGADALVQVLTRKADAALAAKHDLATPAVTKADPDAARTLKLLASVEGAPLEVVAIRSALSASVRDTLKAALKHLDDPQRATVTTGGKTEPILAQWGVSGLVEAKDGDFAALRAAAKSIGVKLK